MLPPHVLVLMLLLLLAGSSAPTAATTTGVVTAVHHCIHLLTRAVPVLLLVPALAGTSAASTIAGTASSMSAAAATPCKYAPDQQLDTLFTSAGRISGGVCRASGENASEAPQCLFDGNLATKWLDFGGGGQNGSVWVE